MGTITLHPDNEADYQLLIELIKRLNLAYTTEDTKSFTQEEFLDGVERGVREIKNHRKGIQPLRNAYDLLNEL
ncbi:MAG: hypothetical protein R2822_08250 [Spirosomataceae bacterium]